MSSSKTKQVCVDSRLAWASTFKAAHDFSYQLKMNPEHQEKILKSCSEYMSAYKKMGGRSVDRHYVYSIDENTKSVYILTAFIEYAEAIHSGPDLWLEKYAKDDRLTNALESLVDNYVNQGVMKTTKVAKGCMEPFGILKSFFKISNITLYDAKGLERSGDSLQKRFRKSWPGIQSGDALQEGMFNGIYHWIKHLVVEDDFSDKASKNMKNVEHQTINKSLLFAYRMNGYENMHKLKRFFYYSGSERKRLNIVLKDFDELCKTSIPLLWKRGRKQYFKRPSSEVAKGMIDAIYAHQKVVDEHKREQWSFHEQQINQLIHQLNQLLDLAPTWLAAQSASQDLEKLLNEIQDFYDPKQFHTRLDQPFFEWLEDQLNISHSLKSIDRSLLLLSDRINKHLFCDEKKLNIWFEKVEKQFADILEKIWYEPQSINIDEALNKFNISVDEYHRVAEKMIRKFKKTMDAHDSSRLDEWKKSAYEKQLNALNKLHLGFMKILENMKKEIGIYLDIDFKHSFSEMLAQLKMAYSQHNLNQLVDGEQLIIFIDRWYQGYRDFISRKNLGKQAIERLNVYVASQMSKTYQVNHVSKIKQFNQFNAVERYMALIKNYLATKKMKIKPVKKTLQSVKVVPNVQHVFMQHLLSMFKQNLSSVVSMKVQDRLIVLDQMRCSCKSMIDSLGIDIVSEDNLRFEYVVAMYLFESCNENNIDILQKECKKDAHEISFIRLFQPLFGYNKVNPTIVSQLFPRELDLIDSERCDAAKHDILKKSNRLSSVSKLFFQNTDSVVQTNGSLVSSVA